MSKKRPLSSSSSSEYDSDDYPIPMPMLKDDFVRMLHDYPEDFQKGLTKDQVDKMSHETIDKMYANYFKEFNEDDGTGHYDKEEEEEEERPAKRSRRSARSSGRSTRRKETSSEEDEEEEEEEEEEEDKEISPDKQEEIFYQTGYQNIINDLFLYFVFLLAFSVPQSTVMLPDVEFGFKFSLFTNLLNL